MVFVTPVVQSKINAFVLELFYTTVLLSFMLCAILFLFSQLKNATNGHMSLFAVSSLTMRIGYSERASKVFFCSSPSRLL
jgi:hypothetical protein